VAGVVAVVGRVVLVAEVLDHVVFDEGVGRPAVEAEVGVAGGGEGAGVVEEPGWGGGLDEVVGFLLGSQ
jgi:hypothetical protein